MTSEITKIREEFGMSEQTAKQIMKAAIALQDAAVFSGASREDVQAPWDTLGNYLTRLESEIVQQREMLKQLLDTNAKIEERMARLRIKNGNYRLGMKQLQKSHEALLYRFNTLKDTVAVRIEYARLVAETQAGTAAQYQLSAFESRGQAVGSVNTRL